jgi:hypothetical protein
MSIRVIAPGKQYEVTDTRGETFILTFRHKNDDQEYIHGISSEDLLDILISRHNYFVFELQRDSAASMQTLVHLKQAKGFMIARRRDKLDRKHRDKG